ncbi:hypothetical protein CHUAL_012575 [Chamberlinius hualienensis]
MKDDQEVGGMGVDSWGDGAAGGNNGGGGKLERCHKCLYFVRAAITFTFSHIGLVSLVVGYTIMGAFAFKALEAEYEQKRTFDMMAKTNSVIDSLWDITSNQLVLRKENWTAAVQFKLCTFEKELVDSVKKNGTDGTVQWTFSGSLLYSIIVITTIGYGNVAPKTRWGKIVTILYAVVGIPLMLLCMSNIGDTLAQSFKFVYWKVCCYLCVQSKNNQKALTRARSLRYRYPSMRHRNSGRGTGSGSHLGPSSASRHSSTRSGATLQGEGGSEAGSGESSGVYSGRGHDVDILAEDLTISNDTYTSRRRHLPTMQQPQSVLHPSGASVKDTELNKVPIILNKYVLESKEDLRVDLPPANHKENLTPAATEFGRSIPMRSLSRMSSRQRKLLHRMHTSHRGGNGLEAYNECDIDLELEELEEISAFEDLQYKEHVTVPIWLCCALVTGYICGGAVLFTFWESWSYLDACYFCFVTLTTIGFGDLVPGLSVTGDESNTTLALCALYLLFGMALLAMSFNLVQEQVTSTVKRVAKSIGILDDDEDEEDE